MEYHILVNAEDQTVIFHVLLDTVDKVKRFVQISSRYPFEIDLSSGLYVVDGKSIMGIFSFNLQEPVEVRILAQDQEQIQAFLADIKPLIVDQPQQPD